MEKLSSKKIIAGIEANKKQLSKFSVKKIGLFGSYSTGTQKKDIDLIVVFNNKSFDNYMDLKFFLEHKFNKKVDLVIEETLKPALSYVKEEAIYARV